MSWPDGELRVGHFRAEIILHLTRNHQRTNPSPHKRRELFRNTRGTRADDVLRVQSEDGPMIHSHMDVKCIYLHFYNLFKLDIAYAEYWLNTCWIICRTKRAEVVFLSILMSIHRYRKILLNVSGS